jgi:hypothetical protein
MVDGYCSWGGTKQKQNKVDMKYGLERERERERKRMQLWNGEWTVMKFIWQGWKLEEKKMQCSEKRTRVKCREREKGWTLIQQATGEEKVCLCKPQI